MSHGPEHEEPDAGAINRGRRAGMADSGAVTGSGAGAGGGGGPEDIDEDGTSGGGEGKAPYIAGQPDEGADASNHGSR